MTSDRTERIAASVYIICKNEEAVIGDCLESLADFAEIIVVDSGSTDGTLAVVRSFAARGHPIRLIEREWPGFGAQKQFALEQCAQDWCLNLDADERVDPVLRDAIGRLVSQERREAAFELPFRNWIPGYGYAPRRVGRDWATRLSRRGKARYDTAKAVHESLNIDGDVGRVTRGAVLHFSNLPLEDYLAKQNRYTSLKAQERIAAGRRARPAKLLLGPLGYFFKFYVVKRYFLCGWAGYIQASLAAQYAFQAEAKHWLAEREAKSKAE